MDYNKLCDDEIFFLQGLSQEDIDAMDIIQAQELTSYDIDISELETPKDDTFDDEPDNDIEPVKPLKSEKENKTSKKVEIKSIHKDHRKRVREKFLKHGLESFSEHEVLELMLFYAIPYKDTNVLAHKLIKKFGSLSGVLDAEYYDLTEVDGISENSASLIVLYRELFKYLRTNTNNSEILRTSDIAGEFCCEYFYNHVEENLILISLDSNKKIKCIDVISKGTENETAFYPRKIMKAVVKNRTNAVILAHNHPGDNPEPSSNDMIITEKLSKLLLNVGVVLIDHIVCSGNKHISFSDKGLIKV